MIKDTIPGVVGNCSVATSFGVAWLTDNAMPALHVISVVVGILASLATAMYYLLEYRRAQKERDQQTRRRRTVQRKKSR